MTSEGHKAKMKENRQCLIKIIESLQYLGRQGLALRGDQSDEDSNFVQLLKLRSKKSSKLKQWHEKKNRKIYFTWYSKRDPHANGTSDITQFGWRNQRFLLCIICDEYTDISNKEQLTLCLR